MRHYPFRETNGIVQNQLSGDEPRRGFLGRIHDTLHQRELVKRPLSRTRLSKSSAFSDSILLLRICRREGLLNTSHTTQIFNQIVVKGGTSIGENHFGGTKVTEMLKKHCAVSSAEVVLVANSSIHREKASIRTKMYELPRSSCRREPI